MRRLLLTLLSALSLVVNCARVEATQYASNLNNPTPQQGIGDIHVLEPGQSFTGAFITGPSLESFYLNFITLESVSASLPEASTISAQLYEEVGSQFVPVGQLGNPVLDPAKTQWPGQTFYLDYAPISPLLLQPSTEYEVVLSEPQNGDDNNALLFSYYTNYASTDGWSIHRPSPTTRPLGEVLSMAVDASPVPDQGCRSGFLLGGSLLAIWVVRRLTCGVRAGI